MKKILVSACLVGAYVRYDGGDNYCDGLARWIAEGRVVPFCPEVAAGLPVPRPPSEISGQGGGLAVLQGDARVIDKEGADVTDFHVAGAKMALEIVRREGIRIAVLKNQSPACGNPRIYDGTFSSRKIDGFGVMANLLKENGIELYNEDQIERVAQRLKDLETVEG